MKSIKDPSNRTCFLKGNTAISCDISFEGSIVLEEPLGALLRDISELVEPDGGRDLKYLIR